MAKSKASVLMLPMSMDIGGAETHVVGLAKGIHSLGWQVYVASYGGRRVKDLAEAGIPHFKAPLHSRSPLNMAKSYRIISNIIDTYNVSLIHAHARIPAWISDKIAKKKNIPLITTYHGTFRSGFPWTLFTCSGDETIAVSSTIKDYIVKEFDFDPRRISVISNGIDVSLFRPKNSPETSEQYRNLCIPPHRKPLIIYVSRLDDSLTNAAIMAQDAVFRLSRKYPNIMLLIAGDGKGLPDVTKRADEINQANGKETIRCLGFVMDTPSLYDVADIVLGMSRVALEAMATAKPVIIFGPNGIFGPATPENIDQLEKRNYVALDTPFPSSPITLGDFIEDLIEHPQKCCDLGNFGRQVIIEHHSIDAMAKATERIYSRLLGIT